MSRVWISRITHTNESRPTCGSVTHVVVVARGQWGMRDAAHIIKPGHTRVNDRVSRRDMRALRLHGCSIPPFEFTTFLQGAKDAPQKVQWFCGVKKEVDWKGWVQKLGTNYSQLKCCHTPKIARTSAFLADSKSPYAGHMHMVLWSKHALGKSYSISKISLGAAKAPENNRFCVPVHFRIIYFAFERIQPPPL